MIPTLPRNAHVRRAACAALVWAGAAAFQGLSQEAAGPETLRRAFLQQVITDSQLLAEQYERALAKLEGELALAADYEEARRVKQRREEIRAVYATLGDASTITLPLLPERARLSGAAEARGEEITGWRSAGSLAEWSAVRVQPGTYHLDLEALLGDLPGAAAMPLASRIQPQDRAGFVFHEPSLLAGAQENRRAFEVVRPTVEGQWTAMRIGPLTFTRSPVTLRLAPAAGYPANVISFRRLRLVPAESGVIQAPPVPEADPFAAAGEALRKSLTSAQKPVLEAYAARLQALAKDAPALKDAVAAELARLDQLQTALAERGEEALLKRLERQMGGVAGFENIEDARLVQPEKASGDRFTIEHAGGRTDIRLLWVNCAPAEDKNGRFKAFASHFRIDVSDIPALARSAREFTVGYLEGRKLRVLLRPGKEAGGSRAALVFLPEVGLYQNILVEQGLAAVEMPAAGARLSITERGLHAALVQFEETARRLKNGAWAIAGEDRKEEKK
ncbi:MAG: hypothetical protein CJBNEKGG_02292 [Prosthecobacter sp.]|nr:hypothetical protein [Prosthecobacter sp.]